MSENISIRDMAGSAALETRTSRSEHDVVNAITEPGTYVCNWSGHLIRAPRDGFGANLHAMSLVAHRRLAFTKISDNPFVTLSRARVIAANSDLLVSF